MMRHLRRWRFFYAAAAVWLAVAAVLPSVSPSTGTPPAPGAFDQPGVSGPTSAPARGEPGTAVTTTVASGPAPTGDITPSGPIAPIATLAAEGRTRNGDVCRAGVPQLSFSTYSPPCVVAFAGDNGGATANGVTRTTITVTDRELADNALLGPGAPSAVEWAVAQTFVAYFNKVFELYGRHVVLEHYHSPHGDQLNEAQGQGQDAACQDAIALTQELHAFAVAYSASPVFEQCAGQHHLVITETEGRPPETFLQQYDPYLWTLEQPCFRIADQTAEYVRKRLAGRQAIYAGDAAYRTQPRKFGILVPDNDIYKPCIAQAKRYFGAPVDEFDFVPDAARFPDEATQAAIHFKADGITTIIISDPVSAAFLMGAAQSEGWYPEWVIDGIGGDNTDSAGQHYNKQEVNGHLFGRSEYPVQDAISGPNSEPARVYRQITGRPFDSANATSAGYGDYDYYELLQLFRLLQAAGPDLTAATLGRGALSLPQVSGPIGVWTYNRGPNGEVGQTEHGATLDGNELYWDAAHAKYIVNKTRYLSGQWPTTPPDVYPRQ